MRLELLVLTHEALDLSHLSPLLLGHLVIAVSQTIGHVVPLLIVHRLSHPQGRIIHLVVMHLLSKYLIILHLELHDLLRLALGVIDLLECPLLLDLKHSHTVPQQLHIFLDGLPHLLHLRVRQLRVFLKLHDEGGLGGEGVLQLTSHPADHGRGIGGSCHI